MKIQKSILAFIILFITCMATVNAEAIEVDDSVNEVVAETTKYYKTVTILNNSEIMTAANFGEMSSLTTEISKEEYDSVDVDGISPQASVTTTYKKLTSTMSKYSSYYYQYKATLEWKNMPATRSYDIIGIGYYASVKYASGATFKQNYCNSDGSCYTQNAGYYFYNGANGVGAMFYLPTSNITSLSQSLTILVEKSSSGNLYEQICTADYSHAQKSISYANAKNFYVNSGGIKLDNSISSYYDAMSSASTTWTGTW